MPDEAFEDVLEAYKHQKGAKSDTDLTAADLKILTEKFKEVTRRKMDSISHRIQLTTGTGHRSCFQDPGMENGLSIIAVRPIFLTIWALLSILSPWSLVIWAGNLEPVLHLPATRKLARIIMFGDYLLNAQGEDVVAGIRNTEKIVKLEKDLPEAYKQFMEITDMLEKHYNDMQDVEFTIENKKLWMLQTRNGKRTAKAAVKMAVDMVNEGLITKEEALLRVTPENVDTLLHPQFDPKAIESAKTEGRYLCHRC